MKIRSLLIDDNEFIVTILADLLQENHPEIEILDIAKNGNEGIEKIKLLQPDLIFLDIEMPDMNGFEMLQKLDAINFQTIFTTAHSHYAIKAFKFNALDYLLKPIDENELAATIRRYKSHNPDTNHREIEHTLDNLKLKNTEDQKLVLPTQNGTLRIALKQIIKIEGDRNYSYIHLSNKSKELSSKTLGYFEDVLLDKDFFRCHRSYVVNKYHIDALQNKTHFLMKDGSEVPISRRKRVEALIWFG